MTELSTLDISRNKFKRLPESIRQLKKLKKLYLNNNPLEELPEWLTELPWLDTLIVRKQNLPGADLIKAHIEGMGGVYD